MKILLLIVLIAFVGVAQAQGPRQVPPKTTIDFQIFGDRGEQQIMIQGTHSRLSFVFQNQSNVDFRQGFTHVGLGANFKIRGFAISATVGPQYNDQKNKFDRATMFVKAGGVVDTHTKVLKKVELTSINRLSVGPTTASRNILKVKGPIPGALAVVVEQLRVSGRKVEDRWGVEKSFANGPWSLLVNPCFDFASDRINARVTLAYRWKL